jgi:hypothetical protein
MKPLASINVSIKGRDWKVSLLTDRAFDKLHNPDGESNAAMTMAAQYEVHFSKNHWDIVNIRHELMHCFYAMAEVNSTDLTPLQVEETMCSIVGQNYAEIGLIADRIAECFFNYNR